MREIVLAPGNSRALRRRINDVVARRESTWRESEREFERADDSLGSADTLAGLLLRLCFVRIGARLLHPVFIVLG